MCNRVRLNLDEQLTLYPILNIFNTELTTELHTDESLLGLDALLMQKDLNSVLPLVERVMRSLFNALQAVLNVKDESAT